MQHKVFLHALILEVLNLEHLTALRFQILQQFKEDIKQTELQKMDLGLMVVVVLIR